MSSVTEMAQTKTFDVGDKLEEVKSDGCSAHYDAVSTITSYSDLKKLNVDKVTVELVESSSRSAVTDP